MTDELKPCPFCGSNNGVVLDSPEYVACIVCGFEGVAIQDYNRRPIEDELRAERDAAVARVAELEARLKSAEHEVHEILLAALSGDNESYLSYDIEGNKYCKWGVVDKDIRAVFEKGGE